MSGSNLTREQKDVLCISPVVAMQNLMQKYEEAALETMESTAHHTTSQAQNAQSGTSAVGE